MISEKELIGLLGKVMGGDEASSGPGEKPVTAESRHGVKDGVAWISQGIIYVRDPEEGGRYATISPAPGLSLYVNGVPKAGTVSVQSSDDIEVKLQKREIAGKYKLKITANKMEAYIFIDPARTLTPRLDDREPIHHLELKPSMHAEMKSPVSLEQVRKMMAEAGVVHGIDLSEMLDFMQNPDRRRVTLARGTPPEPGEDESLEIMFSQVNDFSPAVKEDGKVDFLEVKRTICVEEGVLLAVKRQGVPGRPGLDVCGNEVFPPVPRKISLKLGKGALLDESGTRVLAKRTGRPVVKSSGQVYFIDVEDVMIHEGDVNIRTGNLRFKGSLLVVRGNVEESMTVQATGLIIIDGLVTGAKVIANDNIRISGNCVNSSVSAGVSEELLESVLKCITGIKKGFGRIADIVSILSEQEKIKNSRISYGYMVKLVIEKKITDIPDHLSKLNNNLKSTLVDLPEEVEKSLSMINRVAADPYRINGAEDLSMLMKEIDLVWNFFNSKRAHRADLDMAGALNCRLNASGDVVIRRSGCFNTTIKAGGSVNVTSVFRGGSITAGGNVSINEAGTETGVKTAIETGAKGVVRVSHCNEGVVIKIGKRVGRMTYRVRGLVSRLDSEGDLETTFFRVQE